MDFIGKFGAIKSPKDVRDYKGIAKVSSKDLPKEYSHGMPKVKDQGSVGSCVAHTLSTILEHTYYLYDKEEIEMSVGYIYGNRENSDYKGVGMTVRDALLAICKYGDVPKEYCPDNIEVPEAIKKFEEVASEHFLFGRKFRASKVYRLNNDRDIKAHIMSNGTAVFVVEWYSDMRIKKGVMTSSRNPEDSVGLHCITAYGWNEKGWLIQNSWGDFWGDKGRAILPYDYTRSETWGVCDDYIAKIDLVKVKKPYSSKIGKFFAKIFNKILMLVIKEEKVSDYKEE